jgi:oxalate decarboxylase/phosphoglucose isomerase-like protein (cupin superfamily)
LQCGAKHDVIFIPPDIEHAIYNRGLAPLTFIVVITPVSDDVSAPA